MRENDDGYDYSTWMSEVDDHVRRIAGVSVNDLPDFFARDLWADGCDPEDVAVEQLQDAGFPFDEGEGDVEPAVVVAAAPSPAPSTPSDYVPLTVRRNGKLRTVDIPSHGTVEAALAARKADGRMPIIY